MGIVNVTPDSFSDGGEWFDREAAIAHARELVAEGASILDVGGESTRPFSDPVPLEEERASVVPVMAALVAEHGCDCCLMHMLGDPRTMQVDPRYDDVVSEVKAFLEERAAFAVGQGVAEERIMVDPGIGFGKTVAHNLELLRRLDEIVALGFTVLIGTSRKGFLGKLVGREDPHDRVAATVATNVLALERGATVFRVHDVAATADALTVAAATLRGDGA